VQPKPNDLDVNTTLRRRADKIQQIKSYGVELKRTVERGERAMDECIKKNIEAIRLSQVKAIAGVFISMGESLMGEALAEGPTCVGDTSLRLQGATDGGLMESANKIFGLCKENGSTSTESDGGGVGGTVGTIAGVAKTVSGIDFQEAANVIKGAVSGLYSFTEYMDALKYASSSANMFGIAPVSAIQALGTSLFDLFTAKKQVPSQCIAEQAMETEIAFINANVTKMKRELAQIDKEIGLEE
jgi:hypothetical protein